MMQELSDFLNRVMEDPSGVFNPETVIKYGGLSILFLIIFAETGLFFCFFFPGDSLVFTAGVLCATGDLDAGLITVYAVMIVAAIAGNMVGFAIGKKAGPLLMKRNDSIFFKKEYVSTADNFYKKYGGLALVLGRFLPVIRTFAPIVAGILKISYRRFFMLTVIGAFCWVIPIVSLGYLLGNIIWVKENLGYIIIAMVILITSPVAVRIIAESKKTKK
jgi:membrane-associated protein